MTAQGYDNIEVKSKGEKRMSVNFETADSLPSQCVVYLAPMQDHTIKGFVYSDYYKKTFQFKNECEMLNGMDDLFNILIFPQATFEPRSFFEKKNIKNVRKAVDTLEDKINDIPQNQRTTFIVNVQYRQNATWQGTITWVQQNVTQHFRSAFEMLKLMEQANNHGVTQIIQWDDEV